MVETKALKESKTSKMKILRTNTKMIATVVLLSIFITCFRCQNLSEGSGKDANESFEDILTSLGSNFAGRYNSDCFWDFKSF